MITITQKVRPPKLSKKSFTEAICVRHALCIKLAEHTGRPPHATQRLFLHRHQFPRWFINRCLLRFPPPCLSLVDIASRWNVRDLDPKCSVVTQGVRHRALTDDPSIYTQRHNEVTNGTNHGDMVGLLCVLENIVSYVRIIPLTANIIVRPWTRSPQKQ